MTRKEIEQLADKCYPTAKDVDASLTTISEREGWIAGFEAGMQSVIDNIPDLEWYEFGHLASVSQCLGLLYWIGRLMRGVYEVKVYGLKPDDYTLPCRSVIIGKFKSFNDAKRAANEDYKERIKQVLEL